MTLSVAAVLFFTPHPPASSPAAAVDSMTAFLPVQPSSETTRERALWMSTVAFTVCFAVWTIFSIIGIRIKQELGLNETQFGLLVGTPILTGSLARLVLGIWTGRYGGRVGFTFTMLAAAGGALPFGPA